MSEDWAWLPKGSLPKEFGPFENAAFALKPNEVSEVVRTSLGLHVIQAGERKPAGEEPLAAVKDDIRKELAEQRATDKLSKALDEMQEKLASGEELAKAAGEQQMTVKTSDFFSKDTPPTDLGLSEQALSVLFAMKKGESSDTALATQDGFILAKLVEIKPAGFETLDAVKDVIKDRLVAEGAGRLARTKADAVAKSMESEEGLKKVLAEYKDKIAVSQPFTRQGFIPGLGMAPVLVQTVFETTTPGWFKTVYGVTGGYVLAGLEKRIPADEALWEKEKERWMTTLLQTKRSEMVKAYLQSVQQEAKIEMVNDSVLGPKPGAAAAEASAQQPAGKAAK
jgi:peptidyl-prolyl cis-trans isomerase D